MSDALVNLVSSRLPIVGLAAYAIGLPDRIVASQCLSKSLSPSATEEMLGALTTTGRTLLPSGQAGARYCWTFADIRVYVVARADGTCLSVMIENKPGVQTVRLQDLMQEFGDASPE
jgi:hypothetical protein